MKIYLTTGIKIRINQCIANKLWEAIKSKESEKSEFFRLNDKNTKDTYAIVRISDISCVK